MLISYGPPTSASLFWFYYSAAQIKTQNYTFLPLARSQQGSERSL